MGLCCTRHARHARRARRARRVHLVRQRPCTNLCTGAGPEKSRTHFALWIIIKCHLIIGLDGPPSQQLGPHLPLLKNPVSTKGTVRAMTGCAEPLRRRLLANRSSLRSTKTASV